MTQPMPISVEVESWSEKTGQRRLDLIGNTAGHSRKEVKGLVIIFTPT